LPSSDFFCVRAPYFFLFFVRALDIVVAFQGLFGLVGEAKETEEGAVTVRERVIAFIEEQASDAG